MIKDPIVEEIRKFRDEIQREYGDNYLKHVYREQRRKNHRLVSRIPRKLHRAKAA